MFFFLKDFVIHVLEHMVWLSVVLAQYMCYACYMIEAAFPELTIYTIENDVRFASIYMV